MRREERSPTIIEDVGALAELYAGVFRMMGRRLDPRAPRQKLPKLPDEMLPPPLPDRRERPHRRELARHH